MIAVTNVGNIPNLSKIVSRVPDLYECSKVQRFTRFRNWIITNYLLATGNRIGTILNIKISNVNIEKKVILLEEMKNSRPMELPICDTLANLLKIYIEGIKPLKSTYLFCTYKGTKLSKRGLQCAIANYNKAKHIDKTSCHLYRHRWAQDFCRTNGNIKKLQTLLNHKTLAMSSYYATLYPMELREDVNNYNSLDLALKRYES